MLWRNCRLRRRSPTEGGKWPKRIFRRKGSRLRFQNRPISARLSRRRSHLSLGCLPGSAFGRGEGGGGKVFARLGVGYLPCMLGDITPGLRRVGAVGPELNDELWLLTNPDLRKSKRRDLIEGLWGTTLVPADVAEITAASLLLQTA